MLVRHRRSRSRRDTILGPRGSKSTVQIAFDYPSTWTAFKNSVDVIDGNTGTVATVVAAPAGDLDSKAFYNCIFSPDGKIQRAGTPIDEFKVLSVRDGVLPGYKEIRSEVHGSLAQLAPHRPAGRRHGDANRRHGLHLHRLRGSCQVEGRAGPRDGGGADVYGELS